MGRLLERARRSKLVAALALLVALYSLVMATQEVMWSLWQLFRVGAALLFGAAAHEYWHRADRHRPLVYDDRKHEPEELDDYP